MSASALDRGFGAAVPRRGRLAGAWSRAVAAQSGRAVLWCAPALALGIGGYFSLNSEPSPWFTVMLGVFGGALVWAGRGTGLRQLSGIVLLGFALAAAQCWHVATPLLSATTGEVAVTGRVASVEHSARNRMVMLLAPEAIEGLDASDLPRLLRLSLPAASGTQPPGARVSLTARLAPLPTPVAPGGFDYGRSLWLQGIGGTGRVTSQAITLRDGPQVLLPLDLRLSELRSAMGARIRAVLAPPYDSFAEALITGERGSIPPEINHSLLVSGLYHILSISGLHMWLVAGGVFWAVRAALALAPGFALRFPIRKWAAAAALLMALFYMLLAEGGVATARAFIMVAIVFFAILVDRPALSARNLALAAVVILVLDPHAALEAGFQMSFLAVLGLVAFHEVWARHRRDRASPAAPQRHWVWRLAAWALAAFAASLVTSLVAGVSSALPAAYHFGRISPYGVLANGLAIPVVGVLVMPFALGAALLMPLGLERLPLLVMGRGLQLVIAISDGVAGLPGASEVIARPTELAMLVIAGGMLLLCLLAGPVRLAGLAVMAAGAALALTAPPPPDLLVEASGRNVALRAADGLLVPAHPRRARFAVEKWLQANGEEAGLADAAKRPGWQCAADICTASLRSHRIVYLVAGEGGVIDCGDADIVIAAFPLRGACKGAALRIDRFDLWRSGAHAIDLSGARLRVVTARGEQGQRPWVVVPRPRTQPID